jgi:hypothetical protein
MRPRALGDRGFTTTLSSTGRGMDAGVHAEDWRQRAADPLAVAMIALTAYASNASGRRDVYVREFPSGAWQIRLPTDGRTCPVWRDDGQELDLYQPDGAIVRPSAGVPERLLGVDPRAYRSFDPASGGRRFLMNLVNPENVSRPDDVVVNWPPLLRQR